MFIGKKLENLFVRVASHLDKTTIFSKIQSLVGIWYCNDIKASLHFDVDLSEKKLAKMSSNIVSYIFGR